MDEVNDLSGEVEVISHEPVFVGPYSTLYRGRLRSKGEIVAIKVLNPIRGAAVRTIRRKVKREGSAWALLQHDNILPLYGFADDHERFQPFGASISPWYPQGDLTQYLRGNGASDHLEGRLKIWRGVVAGVAYLHTYTPVIIHGDLKPGNILIDEASNARICDFGPARVIMEEGHHTGLTTTTAHSETPRYLSYELVMDYGAVPTTSSDIYATGCIGLEAVFGEVPYSHHVNGNRLLLDIHSDMKRGRFPANPPDNALVHIDLIWKLISWCWNHEPISRPIANELSAHLEGILIPVHVVTGLAPILLPVITTQLQLGTQALIHEGKAAPTTVRMEIGTDPSSGQSAQQKKLLTSSSTMTDQFNDAADGALDNVSRRTDPRLYINRKQITTSAGSKFDQFQPPSNGKTTNRVLAKYYESESHMKQADDEVDNAGVGAIRNNHCLNRKTNGSSRLATSVSKLTSTSAGGNLGGLPIPAGTSIYHRAEPQRKGQRSVNSYTTHSESSLSTTTPSPRSAGFSNFPGGSGFGVSEFPHPYKDTMGESMHSLVSIGMPGLALPEPRPLQPSLYSYPVITKVIPDSGTMLGGIEVTLLGSNFSREFLTTASVTFGSNYVPFFMVSETVVICTLPHSAVAGPVEVKFVGVLGPRNQVVFPRTQERPRPPIFVYKDESDQDLMITALQALGYQNSGQWEDARSVAMHILGHPK